MTKPNPFMGRGVPYRTYAAIARLMRNEGWVLTASHINSTRVSFVFKRHGLTIEGGGACWGDNKK